MDLNKQLPKLIRDKIPDITTNKLKIRIETIKTKIEDFLFKKLLEEADEVYESRTPEEIWDLLDIIDEICERKWFSKKDIERLRKEKKKRLWWFKKVIILEESDYYN